MDLVDYRVKADQPTDGHAITTLICDVCAQHGGYGDVRWWDADYSPSITELAAEAERHEKQGHKP